MPLPSACSGTHAKVSTKHKTINSTGHSVFTLHRNTKTSYVGPLLNFSFFLSVFSFTTLTLLKDTNSQMVGVKLFFINLINLAESTSGNLLLKAQAK